MWSVSDILRRLIPSCSCGAEYDLRFCAPHILPCAHTFCLMCLSKDKQRNSRRCPLCQKKYSKFILNAALAGVCFFDCVICLECCVGRHNGHDLMVLSSKPSHSSACGPATLPPRLDSKRYLPWRIIQGRCAKPSDSNVGMSSYAVEEDLVCETQSPLYCMFFYGKCLSFLSNLLIIIIHSYFLSTVCRLIVAGCPAAMYSGGIRPIGQLSQAKKESSVSIREPN
uniref:RING-type domain-containing protein n=1 Tax=Angiostrongylus cantonensis TaxID=6313 RepID=A0A0K0D2Q5_ANGCA